MKTKRPGTFKDRRSRSPAGGRDNAIRTGNHEEYCFFYGAKCRSLPPAAARAILQHAPEGRGGNHARP